MNTLRIILCFGLILSSCFKAPFTSLGTVQSVEGAVRVGTAKTLTEHKAVYAFDPNSNSGSVLSAPSGALSGASVTIASHSLAIAADLIFEQAVPLVETSLSSNLQIDAAVTVLPVGAGMIIRPSVELELGSPLHILMPIGSGTSLLKSRNAASSLLEQKYLAVFYKQYRGGILRDGIVSTKDIRLTDDNKVAFEGYFGSYWLVELSQPIEDKAPVESLEPIINFQKVAVIETGGITAESAVKAKAEIPAVAWKSPRLFYTPENRMVSLEGETENQVTMTQCKADIFAHMDDKSGVSIDSGARLQASLLIVKTEAHELFGRFRCFDDQGRLTISGWSSAVAVPAFAVAAIYSSSDFSVGNPQVQSREVLKLILSANFIEDNLPFTVANTTTGATLFDSLAGENLGSNPYARQTNLNDGRAILSLKLSPLGQLQSFAFDANHLSLRGKDGQSMIDAAFTIRDFPIFEASIMTSFSQNRQQANDGFQAWTSILSTPVVSDKESGATRLTHGMLNIINP